MIRPTPAAILARKIEAMRLTLASRPSASSTTLSQSFGLSVEEVRRALRSMGVKDDG